MEKEKEIKGNEVKKERERERRYDIRLKLLQHILAGGD
jgi:hypothetical protein